MLLSAAALLLLLRCCCAAAATTAHLHLALVFVDSLSSSRRDPPGAVESDPRQGIRMRRRRSTTMNTKGARNIQIGGKNNDHGSAFPPDGFSKGSSIGLM
eukprot:GHVU01113662.1.p1 GENE.GHVU01113662.1~~GHVU01113662.1.p1  ORF type:complete len:100 (+),score=9.97 GHVU01113662.1:29-328(+)